MRLGSSSLNDPLIGVSNDYAELCDLGKSYHYDLAALNQQVMIYRCVILGCLRDKTLDAIVTKWKTWKC